MLPTGTLLLPPQVLLVSFMWRDLIPCHPSPPLGPPSPHQTPPFAASKAASNFHLAIAQHILQRVLVLCFQLPLPSPLNSRPHKPPPLPGPLAPPLPSLCPSAYTRCRNQNCKPYRRFVLRESGFEIAYCLSVSYSVLRIARMTRAKSVTQTQQLEATSNGVPHRLVAPCLFLA